MKKDILYLIFCKNHEHREIGGETVIIHDVDEIVSQIQEEHDKEIKELLMDEPNG